MNSIQLLLIVNLAAHPSICGLIIFRSYRMHINVHCTVYTTVPSIYYISKLEHIRCPPGFEPGTAGCEPAILPLHHNCSDKMRFVESLLMLTHPMANNSHFVLGSYDDFNVVRMNE